MGAHLAVRAGEDLVGKLREANDGRLADLVIICFEGFIPLAARCIERDGKHTRSKTRDTPVEHG
jgi:hypothetical protein